jgi:hypothetical protein
MFVPTLLLHLPYVRGAQGRGLNCQQQQSPSAFDEVHAEPV